MPDADLSQRFSALFVRLMHQLMVQNILQARRRKDSSVLNTNAHLNAFNKSFNSVKNLLSLEPDRLLFSHTRDAHQQFNACPGGSPFLSP